MVLGFLSRALRRDQGLNADSPPPTSQGGSGNGADVARKRKEVEHMLANLEKEGVQINDKIASIIDDEVARIIFEVAREDTNEPKRDWRMVLNSIACIAIGFMLGGDCREQAIRAEEKLFWINCLDLAGALFGL